MEAHPPRGASVSPSSPGAVEMFELTFAVSLSAPSLWNSIVGSVLASQPSFKVRQLHANETVNLAVFQFPSLHQRSISCVFEGFASGQQHGSQTLVTTPLPSTIWS